MGKDSFIFYRSFAEAIDDLPDEEQLKIYKAIKEYALNEHEVELAGIAKSFWKLIKPQIAANNKRYQNGTKGGRTSTEIKPRPNQEETKTEPNVNVNVNDNGNGNGNSEKQPPPFFDIQNKINGSGFFLNDKEIESLVSETDPSWFHGHSFIDFIAETVRERYGDKPKRDQHLVFRKLLFDAANLRAEYPAWRTQQEQAAIDREKLLAREQAVSAQPDACPVCGGPLSARLVCAHHGFFEFSEVELAYQFHETSEADISHLRQGFMGRDPGG
jgi:hypothetical protein